MFVLLTPLEFRQIAVELDGKKIGIVDGNRRFTYAECDQRINLLADAFDFFL